MERTVVNISEDFSKIEVNDELIFLGSCFSDSIGDRFKAYKVNSLVNPFGVIFHPMAMANLINRALNDKAFIASDFFEFNDYWFNYELSGSCAKFELEEAVGFANEKLQELKLKLSTANKLIITLGSSIERSVNGKVTANCHKQPSLLFQKAITKASEITNEYESVINQISTLNPDLVIYFTVSPVRHSKEGLVENNRSKANLLLSCEALEAKFKNVKYWPIYELVMDELRDYSFFKEDLVHPNDKAIKYVWNWILTNLTSSNYQHYAGEVSALLKTIQHKSLYPKSEQNLLFLKQTIEKLQNHQTQYKKSWESEIIHVNNQLKIMA